ncbi:DoxX family membrane protein [Glycomyces tenuis]|uniref:DoxX family membrane protein n=1 Tax=Glycomyces tenuis TaxID=58116 RepID=UPI00047BEDB5|nr:DoxX family membrane protein [Glycomyces tenuis]
MSARGNGRVVTTPFSEAVPLRAARTAEPRILRPSARTALVLLRLSLGWIFLWSLLDKIFGLGFSTPPERAWTAGGSPTGGFLASRDGAFGGAFQALAGQAWVDWLFMGAQAALAIALLLGMGMRLAAFGGSLLLLSLWAAMFQPENNPFMDEHLVYMAALVLLAATDAGDDFGLGRPWRGSALVRRFPFLR